MNISTLMLLMYSVNVRNSSSFKTCDWDRGGDTLLHWYFGSG